MVGISFEKFRGPIHDALREYSRRTNGDVVIDLDAASDLVTSPDGAGYAAGSLADLTYNDEPAGKLVTVVLAPGQGTGRQTAEYNLGNLRPGDYPHIPAVVPRSKEGVLAEVALTVVSFESHVPFEPVPHAGNVRLLTLVGGDVYRIADIGQVLHRYHKVMAGKSQAEPTAVQTVGSLDPKEVFSQSRRTGYGHPNALYNPHPTRGQVFSLVRFTEPTQTNRDIITALRAYPAKTRPPMRH